MDWGAWWRAHERRDGLPLRDGEAACQECHGVFSLADTRSEADEQGRMYYWCLICYSHPSTAELAAMVEGQGVPA